MLNRRTALLIALLLLLITAGVVSAWSERDFAHRTLVAYPLPAGHDNIIGHLMTYKLVKGDTLLDVGRWFDLTATEISNANGKLDWWTPPPGKVVVLPSEHILPECERKGLVLNIPEMRLYYFPVKLDPRRHRHPARAVEDTGIKGAPYSDALDALSGDKPSGDKPSGDKKAATKLKVDFSKYTDATVVYTFPVGLGRFDWKTPIGDFKVRGRTHNPTWVVPQDIYLEHLERDGEAEHVIKGGSDDNPLGHYRLELTLPEYALHGTNVPWGVGMEVSHGCVRLYPEDIEALFKRVSVGTPGQFVYQPIKFGWRGDDIYVEVHDDLYGAFPGLWNAATKEAERLCITNLIDMNKLEKAVEVKTGVPTYVMPGPDPVQEIDDTSA